MNKSLVGTLCQLNNVTFVFSFTTCYKLFLMHKVPVYVSHELFILSAFLYVMIWSKLDLGYKFVDAYLLPK